MLHFLLRVPTRNHKPCQLHIKKEIERREGSTVVTEYPLPFEWLSNNMIFNNTNFFKTQSLKINNDICNNDTIERWGGGNHSLNNNLKHLQRSSTRKPLSYTGSETFRAGWSLALLLISNPDYQTGLVEVKRLVQVPLAIVTNKEKKSIHLLWPWCPSPAPPVNSKN